MQNKICRTPLGTTPHFQSLPGCSCNSQNKGWSIAGILTPSEKIEIHLWEIVFALKCDELTSRASGGTLHKSIKKVALSMII